MQYMESVSNEYLGYAEEQHCVDKLVNMTCKHCCQAPKEPLRLAGERSVIFVAGERTPAALTIVPHRVCAFVPKVAHVPTSPMAPLSLASIFVSRKKSFIHVTSAVTLKENLSISEKMSDFRAFFFFCF